MKNIILFISDDYCCVVTFVTREIHDGDIEEEIREAFRVFDKEGHGFIPVPDLTEVHKIFLAQPFAREVPF